MCIIVDTNCLCSVFEPQSANHKNFKPVFDWVYMGKGKIVYGGSKYLEEINEKYLGIILQIRKAGKAIYVDCDLVDNETDIVSGMIQHKDFDDQHLVALLRISKCKLICSLDKRAYPFFRHNIFFTPAINKPKIYSSIRNSNLLNPNNIADICKPCTETTKVQKQILGI